VIKNTLKTSQREDSTIYRVKKNKIGLLVGGNASQKIVEQNLKSKTKNIQVRIPYPVKTLVKN
jgi:hypothetical protein